MAIIVNLASSLDFRSVNSSSFATGDTTKRDYVRCVVRQWNESGFRPPLCTYRLNWARRTSWGWWDDWDDTVLQTQDSKFEPWRSEAEHATSRSRRLPTILTFTRGWGRNIFVSFKPPRTGTEPRTLAWKAAVLTTTLGPPPVSSGMCRLNQGNVIPLYLKSNMRCRYSKCISIEMVQSSTINSMSEKNVKPLGTWRCCDVKSTSTS